LVVVSCWVGILWLLVDCLLIRQTTKNKEQTTKNKQQRTKNKEQTTKNKEQTTNNKEPLPEKKLLSKELINVCCN
jgi:sortase (surface protein transpeptidase)